MDIWSMTRSALEEWFLQKGENPSKAALIFEQIYRRGIRDFSELPFAERIKTALAEKFSLELPQTEIVSPQETLRLFPAASDIGTDAARQIGSAEKLLLKLSDGEFVESVLMRQKYGVSVCVSTQVGCAMGCKFCQSGRLKKRRSLTAGEMTAQVMKLKQIYSAEIHSVTVMGIGEPFDNFEAVRDFCDIITDSRGLALGEKHVTVSTCGIVPGINRWAELTHPCSLAVSLHAPDDALRSEIMPVNRRYPVREVIAAARAFAERHNRRVTLEYVMLSGVNDSPEQAEKLSELVAGSGCFYVNIIPYNGNDSGFERSSRERIAAFYDVLKKRGVSVTMRREFGSAIGAACGQLSSEHGG